MAHKPLDFVFGAEPPPGFGGQGRSEPAGGQLDSVAAELNDRPRLCLGDQTPQQAVQRWARQQAQR